MKQHRNTQSNASRERDIKATSEKAGDSADNISPSPVQRASEEGWEKQAASIEGQ